MPSLHPLISLRQYIPLLPKNGQSFSQCVLENKTSDFIMETASRDAYSVASGTMEPLLLPTSQAQVPRLPAEVHGREVYRRWNLWVAVCLGSKGSGSDGSILHRLVLLAEV